MSHSLRVPGYEPTEETEEDRREQNREVCHFTVIFWTIANLQSYLWYVCHYDLTDDLLLHGKNERKDPQSKAQAIQR